MMWIMNEIDASVFTCIHEEIIFQFFERRVRSEILISLIIQYHIHERTTPTSRSPTDHKHPKGHKKIAHQTGKPSKSTDID